MQTTNTATHSVSHTPKRTQTPAKPLLGDVHFLSLIEEVRSGLPPSASRKDVLRAIASGNVSPDIVEELEDAILISLIEERRNSPIISREEVMKILDE